LPPTLAQSRVQSHDKLYKTSRDILYPPAQGWGSLFVAFHFLARRALGLRHLGDLGMTGLGLAILAFAATIP
jgi:hypothetical protein